MHFACEIVLIKKNWLLNFRLTKQLWFCRGSKFDGLKTHTSTAILRKYSNRSTIYRVSVAVRGNFIALFKVFKIYRYCIESSTLNVFELAEINSKGAMKLLAFPERVSALCVSQIVWNITYQTGCEDALCFTLIAELSRIVLIYVQRLRKRFEVSTQKHVL